jgi:hypothetical protein
MSIINFLELKEKLKIQKYVNPENLDKKNHIFFLVHQENTLMNEPGSFSLLIRLVRIRFFMNLILKILPLLKNFQIYPISKVIQFPWFASG